MSHQGSHDHHQMPLAFHNTAFGRACSPEGRRGAQSAPSVAGPTSTAFNGLPNARAESPLQLSNTAPRQGSLAASGPSSGNAFAQRLQPSTHGSPAASEMMAYSGRPLPSTPTSPALSVREITSVSPRNDSIGTVDFNRRFASLAEMMTQAPSDPNSPTPAPTPNTAHNLFGRPTAGLIAVTVQLSSPAAPTSTTIGRRVAQTARSVTIRARRSNESAVVLVENSQLPLAPKNTDSVDELTKIAKMIMSRRAANIDRVLAALAERMTRALGTQPFIPTPLTSAATVQAHGQTPRRGVLVCTAAAVQMARLPAKAAIQTYMHRTLPPTPPTFISSVLEPVRAPEGFNTAETDILSAWITASTLSPTPPNSLASARSLVQSPTGLSTSRPGSSSWWRTASSASDRSSSSWSTVSSTGDDVASECASSIASASTCLGFELGLYSQPNANIMSEPEPELAPEDEFDSESAFETESDDGSDDGYTPPAWQIRLRKRASYMLEWVMQYRED